VLVVAKETAASAALTAFLGDKGFHVTTAGNEEEALRRLARAPQPRLVLLDLDTAVRESLEVCRHRLQTDGLRKIPLVAVSDGQGLPAPLAVALGIVAHLGKPLCPDTLLETVERLCA
jgi:CheY-like chemotaxis protein